MNIPCSVETTGIQGVRLNALSLTSKDHFDCAWKYMSLTVPEVLEQIQGWCQTCVLEKCLELKAIVGQELEVCLPQYQL